MISALRPVRSLLTAIFVLMAGAGFMGSLVSLRLEGAGANAMMIGLAATAYFAGLSLGSRGTPRIIGGVGHIRAFAAFVALLSASTLAYALHLNGVFWTVLRFIDGLCVAGVYVCLESWLNDRADRERGTVLSAYMIALYAGQALGQFMLSLGGKGSPMPFIASSILISLAIIPITLTRSASPAIQTHPPLPLRELYQISPLGLVGSALTGVMLGAFYGLGAVYARRLGLSVPETASFMSAVIAGGVVLQWPLGLLSDRFDRRKVIVGALAGTTAVAVGLALAGAPGVVLLILGGLFGGLSFALYPLCVAHANDHVDSERRVGASGGLVLVYSGGAAAGPAAGSVALAAFGPLGLFAFIAACAGAALVFALWRLGSSPPVPSELQQSYQLLPRTTPMSAALDPVASEPQ